MSINQLRSFERWEGYSRKEFTLNEFLDVTTELQGENIISIKFDDKYLDLLVRINKYSPIVTLFHGAVQRTDKLKLPVFSGLNIVDDSYSRVLVCDSSLGESESLTLGWFGGSAHIDLQNVLPLILKKIFNISQPSKKIFAGGSGGGFASLYYSSLFENVFVIASNPQTDIKKYYQTHVKNYANLAWKCDVADLGTKIHHDLKSVYKRNVNTVLYIQNREDRFHIDNHCMPFLCFLTDNKINTSESFLIKDSFYFKSAFWGSGHIGPPPIYWKIMIDYLANYNGAREDVFSCEQFDDVSTEANKACATYFVEISNSYFSKGESEKSLTFIDKYFGFIKKPSPEMCILSLKVAFDLGYLEKLESYYSKSKVLYPRGWSLVFYYATYIYKLGFFDKAIIELENFESIRKEKTPPPILKLLSELKEK